jgi:hypothetical protein
MDDEQWTHFRRTRIGPFHTIKPQRSVVWTHKRGTLAVVQNGWIATEENFKVSMVAAMKDKERAGGDHEKAKTLG